MIAERVSAALVVLSVSATAAAQPSAPVYGSVRRQAVGDNGSSYPNAATLDSRGRLLVVNSGQHTVEVYGIDGTVVAHYGSRGHQRELYTYGPPEQTVPIALTNALGCELTPVQPPAVRGLQCLSYPQGIAVDGADRIYVTDTGNYRVLVFDSADARDPDGSLKLLYAFGTFGGTVVDPCPCYDDATGALVQDSGVIFTQAPPEPDKFAQPWDIEVYRATGDVFVLDQWNNQIKQFTFNAAQNTYREIAAFGHRGDVDTEGLVFPTGFGLDQRTGDIAVADSGKHRVVVYAYPFTSATTSAAIVSTAGPGGPDVFGRHGGYIQQGDVAFDNAHRLFVLDSVSSAIHVFTRAGAAAAGYTFAFTIQKSAGGSPDGLNDPQSISIAQPDDTLDLETDLGTMVIADTSGGRISLFQPARLTVDAVNFTNPNLSVGLDGTPIESKILVTNRGAIPIVDVTPTLSNLGGLISTAPNGINSTPSSATVAARGGQQEFTVRLMPQGLGTLSLRVGATGTAKVEDASGQFDPEPVSVTPLYDHVPDVTIGCAGNSNPIIVRSATTDATSVRSGLPFGIHVTLQNCSESTLEAVPVVTPAASGLVTFRSASGTSSLGSTGTANSTQTWDVTFVAGKHRRPGLAERVGAHCR